MIDLFSKLPAPILLHIMKILPNLLSLQVLTQASPSALSMFEDCSSEIIDAIITDLSIKLQQAIRAIALALEACSRGTNSIALQMTLNDAYTNHTDGFPIGVAVTKSKFSGVSIANPSELLAIASQIHHLSFMFLDEHLHRLHSISPQHLKDPEFLNTRLPLDEDIPGRSYSPKHTEGFSWIEEYRITSALWLIQLSIFIKPLHPEPSHQRNHDRILLRG